ncbi:Hypothetical protein, putative [Bodo saltans]|uniref:Uncharacterized protein n=1 Tax=Bodo saltans TaxID=75058 RepID=A0A0S4JD44_BODSA|nr:Hypothetical protein, putative [Bodo saltans]|eukprot:CUG87111.1 Hypothetical protein, putative [Bodo saltans]
MPPKRKTASATAAVRSAAPAARKASTVANENVAVPAASSSNKLSDAHQSTTLNPRARVLELLGATSLSSSGGSNGIADLVGSSVATTSPFAFRSVSECATMLRAVYVVTQTDKAQLKLRPQELSHVALQSSAQHQQHNNGMKYSLSAPSSVYSGGGGVFASPSKMVASGLQDYSGSRVGLPASKPPLPTPPPSPSRFFESSNNEFSSPSRPPRASSVGQEKPLFTGDAPFGALSTQLTPTTTPTSSPEPLNLAVFADQRWRNAVSMMIGDASVTLDQLARLAKLFPTYLRVSLSAPSALVERSGGAGGLNTSRRPASTYRIDEALRLLSEDAFGCGGGGGGATSLSSIMSDALDDNNTSRSADVLSSGGRLRVTLLKPEVPSLDTLIADISARGGEALLRSVEHDTAASLHVLDNNRKRGRDSESPTPADTSSPQPTAAPVAVAADNLVHLPAHLLEVLSDSKRHHVMQAVLVEQQAIRDDQAQVLDRRVAWEKMLGIFDLIRICFGAPVFDAQRNVKCYRQLGGAKLVTLLVSQNRYGCTKEEIALLLQRLLQFSESGLRISTINWGGVDVPQDEELATTTLIPTGGGQQHPLPPRDDAFDAVLFHLSPTASRAKLEIALEDQSTVIVS